MPHQCHAFRCICVVAWRVEHSIHMCVWFSLHTPISIAQATSPHQRNGEAPGYHGGGAPHRGVLYHGAANTTEALSEDCHVHVQYPLCPQSEEKHPSHTIESKKQTVNLPLSIGHLICVFLLVFVVYRFMLMCFVCVWNTFDIRQSTCVNFMTICVIRYLQLLYVTYTTMQEHRGASSDGGKFS